MPGKPYGEGGGLATASVVYCVMMRLEEGVNHFNPPVSRCFPLFPSAGQVGKCIRLRTTGNVIFAILPASQ
jgi:hypothetical protein